MCGIVGILNRDPSKPVNRRLLAEMNALIHHRGPDEVGEYVSGPVGLGHRRLSVIDLASGHQPMRDEARGRVIIYNGETYNFRALRDTLTDRPFHTDSDTEVLLQIAEFDRTDWLERLNGMFAFAVWDERHRQLLLARDRLGIKPLYYVELTDAFLFSSEIKPLLLHPQVARRVNAAKVPEYLAFRTITGEDTLFEGIKELAPGCAMRIRADDHRIDVTRWWREGEGKTFADYAPDDASFEDQFATLMKNAVRHRLVSDVPVGSFNSGGVDSSLNTAIMRSLTEGEMHTFSVGFDNPDYDERPYAQAVADKLGTHHHALVVTEDDFVGHLDETLVHLEEPINHANTVHLLLLSRLARQYVTVALTGEGADELFGGYPRLQIPVLARHLSRLPRFVNTGLLQLCRATGQRRLVKLFETADDLDRSVIENARYAPGNDFDALFPSPQGFADRRDVYDRSASRSDSIVARSLYFEQRTYLPSLLNRLDKTSMAIALECRVPFLDPALMEWSYLLPDRYKIRMARANKYIVKKVAERWLPKDIVYRKKVGFGTPVAEWLRNPSGLGRYLDLLRDRAFREREFFDTGAVGRIIDAHLAGEDHHEILWGLINLELWCRTFIDADVNAALLDKHRAAPHSPAQAQRA